MPDLVNAGAAWSIAAANYLKVQQSPGAAYADKDGNVITSAPLMTFNTPNLQMFKVTITGEDLVTNAGAANSSWSKAIRALQVTSEIFAVFPPEYDSITEGASTFCFLAPDFNTNAGAVSVTGNAQTAIAERGGNFSVVEKALTDALGGTATVIRCMLVGAAIVDEVAPV